MDRNPVGTHVIIDFYGAEDPGEKVEAILAEVARLAQCQVLQVAQHVFSNGGRTRLLLLSKSHTSIHTWPEKKYVAFDLFSCEALTEEATQEVMKFVKDAIRHEKDISEVVKRGEYL